MKNNTDIIEWAHISATPDGVASVNFDEILRVKAIQDHLKQIESFNNSKHSKKSNIVKTQK